MKLLVGVVIGLLLGAVCRRFDLPVPSPPNLMGALLVVAVTIGYVATDWAMGRQAAEPSEQMEVAAVPSSPVPVAVKETRQTPLRPAAAH